MEMGLDRHIEITPDVRFGKPRLAGTRVTVADVATMYLHAGMSLEEIAGDYSLSLAAVYAAMAYYYDHQAEIARQIMEEQAAYEAGKQNSTSLLDEKLRAVNPDVIHAHN